jgi:UDPglucose 6-dehydrogenase
MDVTITVLGAGYVGLTSAAIFAQSGYQVFVVEPNPKRLEVIKQGRSFFFEHGLDALVAKGIADKTLIPTDSYEQSVPESDYVFSCVGTPDNPDGSSNLTFVFDAAETTLKYAKKDIVYVQKSTVPVGTGTKIEDMIAKQNAKIAYVSNPEFLRESTALRDTLFFDRIVVGGSDIDAVRKVLELYQEVEDRRESIARLSGLDVETKAGRYIETNLNSAELIKVTSNAFLALKITFANSIAKLADQTGADVNEVMDAVGADQRIGRAFLSAGRGFGGGCFPKDVSGLISSAADYGVDLPIMTAVSEVNDSMPGYIAQKIQNTLGDVHGKHVAVLGLAFKAGTSDARRSPGVSLANILSKNGAHVSAYDPEANDEAKDDLREDIKLLHSLESAVKDADAVLVATDWPEFLAYDLSHLAKQMKGNLLVDCMNAYDISDVKGAGLQYLGVGR